MIEDNRRQLTEYLRYTKRAVNALFDQRGLEDLGGGTYCYLARPIRVVWWDVVPFLSFHTEQPSRSKDREFDLMLVLDSCRLSGDERWSVVSNSLTFNCHATFQACLGGVQAQVSVGATITSLGWLQLVPEVVIRELATPVVDLVLDRLLLRSHKSMRKDMEQWLKQTSSLPSC